ncbi:hypothetical protein [Roseateles sp. LYH14W]|uniref:Secreted protein n=1 Tax=Pelomonas parva TaxID=3299032 RepID=A0ABW7F4U6_9BURK
MKKLFSSRLAVAVNAAFVATVVLSACANPAEKSDKQNLSSEEAARLATEKREADQKRARAGQHRQLPSGVCGQQ